MAPIRCFQKMIIVGVIGNNRKQMSLNCYNFSTSSKRPYLNLCLIILGLTVSLGCSSKEKQKEELNFVGASNLCDHYAAVAP